MVFQHDAQEFIALFLDNLHEHLNTANMCKLYINTAAASICSPRAKQQPNNLTDNDNELSPRPKGTGMNKQKCILVKLYRFELLFYRL